MHDFAIGERVRQLFQRRANFGDARQNLLAGHDGDVIFGEIHAGFEEGDEFYQLLLDWLYAVGQCAFKLLRRNFGLEQGLRINQIADGFGLGEIDAAVQEGAHGEFAGLSQARSGCQRQLDDASQNHWRAVGGDFDNVVCGVRVGLLEESDYDLIQALICLGLNQFAEGGALRLKLMPQAQHGRGDFSRIRAGKACHSNPAAAGRRGKGDNSVVEMHQIILWLGPVSGAIPASVFSARARCR